MATIHKFNPGPPIEERDDLIQYTDLPALKKSKMLELIKERIELKEVREAADERMKEISDEVKEILIKAGVEPGEDKIQVLNTRIMIIAPKPRKSFDQPKAQKSLLKAGVGMKLIEKAWAAATTEKPVDPYVDIRGLDNKEGK